MRQVRGGTTPSLGAKCIYRLVPRSAREVSPAVLTHGQLWALSGSLLKYIPRDPQLRSIMVSLSGTSFGGGTLENRNSSKSTPLKPPCTQVTQGLVKMQIDSGLCQGCRYISHKPLGDAVACHCWSRHRTAGCGKGRGPGIRRVSWEPDSATWQLCDGGQVA